MSSEEKPKKKPAKLGFEKIEIKGDSKHFHRSDEKY
jgi:hypothetical protein